MTSFSNTLSSGYAIRRLLAGSEESTDYWHPSCPRLGSDDEQRVAANLASDAEEGKEAVVADEEEKEERVEKAAKKEEKESAVEDEKDVREEKAVKVAEARNDKDINFREIRIRK